MGDRYKELWNKIGARQDELHSRQEALEAEEDLANFDITEWKKRFLRWMDGNHERYGLFYSDSFCVVILIAEYQLVKS